MQCDVTKKHQNYVFSLSGSVNQSKYQDGDGVMKCVQDKNVWSQTQHSQDVNKLEKNFNVSWSRKLTKPNF